MKKQHEQELLDWVKAAIKELDKLDHDRSSRVLRDGGKALVKEIEENRNNKVIEEIILELLKDKMPPVRLLYVKDVKEKYPKFKEDDIMEATKNLIKDKKVTYAGMSDDKFNVLRIQLIE